MLSNLGKWQRRGVYLVIASVVWLVVKVDDWGRDFVRNEAAISSRDYPSLQRLLDTRNLREIAAAVEQAARRNPSYGKPQRLEQGNTIQIGFLRTTRLLRFKEDVVITVTRENGRPLVTGHSASRFGKGDLGQNPRNLTSLLGEMEVVLNPLTQSARSPVLRPPRSLFQSTGL